MRIWRMLMALVGALAIQGGLDRAAANPLPACEWEDDETVLGFYGSGLVATNAVAPEPNGFSPHSLCLQAIAPVLPQAGAQITYFWTAQQIGDVRVMLAYYLDEPTVVQWQLQGRWNDSLPGDTQADDGVAGGVSIEPLPGWNYIDHVFAGDVDHRGLVVTITPTVPTPGVIWIDLLIVTGDGPATIQTPCYQWVDTESRQLGEIKTLFR